MLCWDIAFADFEIDETKGLLLTKIVQLFLTVKGLPFAGVTMERQTTNNTTCKSLHRDLYDDTNSLCEVLYITKWHCK